MLISLIMSFFCWGCVNNLQIQLLLFGCSVNLWPDVTFLQHCTHVQTVQKARERLYSVCACVCEAVTVGGWCDNKHRGWESELKQLGIPVHTRLHLLNNFKHTNRGTHTSTLSNLIGHFLFKLLKGHQSSIFLNQQSLLKGHDYSG